MTALAPARRAARILSKYPPAEPVSLVTIQAAFFALSMATLVSSSKGPCMAMIWSVATPHWAQVSRDDAMGSTRA